jgi:hypothetical protein
MQAIRNLDFGRGAFGMLLVVGEFQISRPGAIMKIAAGSKVRFLSLAN